MTWSCIRLRLKESGINLFDNGVPLLIIIVVGFKGCSLVRVDSVLTSQPGERRWVHAALATSFISLAAAGV